MTQHTTSKLFIEPLDIAPDTEMITLFQHFAHEPMAILLDSANCQHPNARFDIMVAQPVRHVVGTGHQSQLWEQQTCIEEQDTCPLEWIKQLHDCLYADVSVNAENACRMDLPFLVGAMGHFGYDLGRRFERLPDTAEKDCTTPDLAVGLYSWSVIRDLHRGLYYLCYLDNFPHPSATQLASLVNESRAVSPFKLTTEWQANLSKEQYVERLERIDAYLRAGDCYQVNMAQRFTNQYRGDPWSAYLTLRDANKAPFSAFVQLPDSTIVSISPERFIHVTGDHVETKPIKGTRPRSADPAQDQLLKSQLQQAEKDRAENLMIVDLLRNDLSKHCLPDSVNVPSLFNIESFPAVHHLVSTVTGRLAPNANVLDLLKGAFPGGSITGAPKIRAMQIIDELEPHRRNIYCGSIGYMGLRHDMDTSICIRTLLCENGTIHCWAGGGIVLDSDAEDEYQESLDKVNKILPVLRQCH